MAQALAHVQEVTGSIDGIHFMNGGKSEVPRYEYELNLLLRNRVARHRRKRRW